MSTAHSHETPPTAQRFYFIPEAAKELRRSDASVRWLIQTGQLRSAKLGGRRVVTQAQLDQFFTDAFAIE